jgi:hypothetical protein
MNTIPGEEAVVLTLPEANTENIGKLLNHGKEVYALVPTFNHLSETLAWMKGGRQPTSHITNGGYGYYSLSDVEGDTIVLAGWVDPVKEGDASKADEACAVETYPLEALRLLQPGTVVQPGGGLFKITEVSSIGPYSLRRIEEETASVAYVLHPDDWTSNYVFVPTVAPDVILTGLNKLFSFWRPSLGRESSIRINAERGIYMPSVFFEALTANPLSQHKADGTKILPSAVLQILYQTFSIAITGDTFLQGPLAKLKAYLSYLCELDKNLKHEIFTTLAIYMFFRDSLNTTAYSSATNQSGFSRLLTMFLSRTAESIRSTSNTEELLKLCDNPTYKATVKMIDTLTVDSDGTALFSIMECATGQPMKTPVVSRKVHGCYAVRSTSFAAPSVKFTNSRLSMFEKLVGTNHWFAATPQQIVKWLLIIAHTHSVPLIVKGQQQMYPSSNALASPIFYDPETRSLSGLPEVSALETLLRPQDFEERSYSIKIVGEADTTNFSVTCRIQGNWLVWVSEDGQRVSMRIVAAADAGGGLVQFVGQTPSTEMSFTLAISDPLAPTLYRLCCVHRLAPMTLVNSPFGPAQYHALEKVLTPVRAEAGVRMLSPTIGTHGLLAPTLGGGAAPLGANDSAQMYRDKALALRSRNLIPLAPWRFADATYHRAASNMLCLSGLQDIEPHRHTPKYLKQILVLNPFDQLTRENVDVHSRTFVSWVQFCVQLAGVAPPGGGVPPPAPGDDGEGSTNISETSSETTDTTAWSTSDSDSDSDSDHGPPPGHHLLLESDGESDAEVGGMFRGGKVTNGAPAAKTKTCGVLSTLLPVMQKATGRFKATSDRMYQFCSVHPQQVAFMICTHGSRCYKCWKKEEGSCCELALVRRLCCDECTAEANKYHVFGRTDVATPVFILQRCANHSPRHPGFSKRDFEGPKGVPLNPTKMETTPNYVHRGMAIDWFRGPVPNDPTLGPGPWYPEIHLPCSRQFTLYPCLPPKYPAECPVIYPYRRSNTGLPVYTGLCSQFSDFAVVTDGHNFYSTVTGQAPITVTCGSSHALPTFSGEMGEIVKGLSRLPGPYKLADASSVQPTPHHGCKKNFSIYCQTLECALLLGISPSAPLVFWGAHPGRAAQLAVEYARSLGFTGPVHVYDLEGFGPVAGWNHHGDLRQTVALGEPFILLDDAGLDSMGRKELELAKLNIIQELSAVGAIACATIKLRPDAHDTHCPVPFPCVVLPEPHSTLTGREVHLFSTCTAFGPLSSIIGRGARTLRAFENIDQALGAFLDGQCKDWPASPPHGARYKVLSQFLPPKESSFYVDAVTFRYHVELTPPLMAYACSAPRSDENLSPVVKRYNNIVGATSKIASELKHNVALGFNALVYGGPGGIGKSTEIAQRLQTYRAANPKSSIMWMCHNGTLAETTNAILQAHGVLDLAAGRGKGFCYCDTMHRAMQTISTSSPDLIVASEFTQTASNLLTSLAHLQSQGATASVIIDGDVLQQGAQEPNANTYGYTEDNKAAFTAVIAAIRGDLFLHSSVTSRVMYRFPKQCAPWLERLYGLNFIYARTATSFELAWLPGAASQQMAPSVTLHGTHVLTAGKIAENSTATMQGSTLKDSCLTIEAPLTPQGHSFATRPTVLQGFTRFGMDSTGRFRHAIACGLGHARRGDVTEMLDSVYQRKGKKKFSDILADSTTPTSTLDRLARAPFVSTDKTTAKVDKGAARVQARADAQKASVAGAAPVATRQAPVAPVVKTNSPQSAEPPASVQVKQGRTAASLPQVTSVWSALFISIVTFAVLFLPGTPSLGLASVLLLLILPVFCFPCYAILDSIWDCSEENHTNSGVLINYLSFIWFFAYISPKAPIGMGGWPIAQFAAYYTLAKAIRQTLRKLSSWPPPSTTSLFANTWVGPGNAMFAVLAMSLHALGSATHLVLVPVSYGAAFTVTPVEIFTRLSTGNGLELLMIVGFVSVLAAFLIGQRAECKQCLPLQACSVSVSRSAMFHKDSVCSHCGSRGNWKFSCNHGSVCSLDCSPEHRPSCGIIAHATVRLTSLFAQLSTVVILCVVALGLRALYNSRKRTVAVIAVVMCATLVFLGRQSVEMFLLADSRWMFASLGVLYIVITFVHLAPRKQPSGKRTDLIFELPPILLLVVSAIPVWTTWLEGDDPTRHLLRSVIAPLYVRPSLEETVAFLPTVLAVAAALLILVQRGVRTYLLNHRVNHWVRVGHVLMMVFSVLHEELLLPLNLGFAVILYLEEVYRQESIRDALAIIFVHLPSLVFGPSCMSIFTHFLFNIRGMWTGLSASLVNMGILPLVCADMPTQFEVTHTEDGVSVVEFDIRGNRRNFKIPDVHMALGRPDEGVYPHPVAKATRLEGPMMLERPAFVSMHIPVTPELHQFMGNTLHHWYKTTPGMVLQDALISELDYTEPIATNDTFNAKVTKYSRARVNNVVMSAHDNLHFQVQGNSSSALAWQTTFQRHGAHAHDTANRAEKEQIGRDAAVTAADMFQQTDSIESRYIFSRAHVKYFATLSRKCDIESIAPVSCYDIPNRMIQIMKTQSKPVSFKGAFKAFQPTNALNPAQVALQGAIQSVGLEILFSKLKPEFVVTASGRHTVATAWSQLRDKMKGEVYMGDIGNCDGSHSEATYSFLTALVERLRANGIFDDHEYLRVAFVTQCIVDATVWGATTFGKGTFTTSHSLASGRKWTLLLNVIHVMMILIIAYGALTCGIFQGDDSAVCTEARLVVNHGLLLSMGVVLKTFVSPPGEPFEFAQFVFSHRLPTPVPYIHRRAAQALFKPVPLYNFNSTYFTEWLQNIQEVFEVYQNPEILLMAAHEHSVVMEVLGKGETPFEFYVQIAQYVLAYSRLSSQMAMSLFRPFVLYHEAGNDTTVTPLGHYDVPTRPSHFKDSSVEFEDYS